MATSTATRAAQVGLGVSRAALSWTSHRLLIAARRFLLITCLFALWLTYVVVETVRTHALQTLLALGAALVIVLTWRRLHPEHFHRVVLERGRSAWRGWWVYRRHWQAVMTLSGLTKRLHGVEQVPAPPYVTCVGGFDIAVVAMLPGQVFEDWAAANRRLAQSFGAQDCRVVREEHPQCLSLVFLHDDPLVESVPTPRLDDVVDPDRLPVAMTEYGGLYGLRLYGTHLLLAGATGAGKSGALWSILYALSPGIGRGIDVWMLDPKGGQEFYAARDMFRVFAPMGDGSPSEFADRLEEAVDIMRQRQTTLRAGERAHAIGPDMPWLVIIVDEIASLTAYNLDRDAKKRIDAGLNLLLSQGRMAGITVIGALQDPRKEVLTMRDLFPTRIGLQMSEAQQVSMVLGDGARERGALCDQIAKTAQGVAYVVEDGTAGVERIRFSFVDDDNRNQMIARCSQALAAAQPVETSTTGEEAA